MLHIEHGRIKTITGKLFGNGWISDPNPGAKDAFPALIRRAKLSMARIVVIWPFSEPRTVCDTPADA
jgi:hypothetical protein